MSEYGAVTQFLLANPPVGIASGAVGVALLFAFFLRLFRNEVRSVALDRAAAAVLKSVQDDNALLRKLVREVEEEKNQLRKQVLDGHLEFGQRLASLSATVDVLYQDKKRLDAEKEEMQKKLSEATSEILKLEMQVAGQLSTIEDMALTIQELKQSLVGRRRSTDH